MIFTDYIITCSFLDPSPSEHGGILHIGVWKDYGRFCGSRRQIQCRGQHGQTPHMVVTMVHFRGRVTILQSNKNENCIKAKICNKNYVEKTDGVGGGCLPMWRVHMNWHCARSCFNRYSRYIIWFLFFLSLFATITPQRREEKLNIYFVLLSTNRMYNNIVKLFY